MRESKRAVVMATVRAQIKFRGGLCLRTSVGRSQSDSRRDQGGWGGGEGESNHRAGGPGRRPGERNAQSLAGDTNHGYHRSYYEERQLTVNRRETKGEMAREHQEDKARPKSVLPLGVYRIRFREFAQNLVGVGVFVSSGSVAWSQSMGHN